MERIPNELLQHVFVQFSSLIDLTKCFNTCIWWRQNIEHMFRKSKNGKHPIDKLKFIKNATMILYIYSIFKQKLWFYQDMERVLKF